MNQFTELREAVLAAERGVVDTGSYEIIHLDRNAWDRVVQLARGLDDEQTGEADSPLAPGEVVILKELAAAVGEYLLHIGCGEKFAAVYFAYARLEHFWDAPTAGGRMSATDLDR
jgi:hypothetical protein